MDLVIIVGVHLAIVSFEAMWYILLKVTVLLYSIESSMIAVNLMMVHGMIGSMILMQD